MESDKELRHMHIEAYREHCLSKIGVTESIPFSRAPNILVFKVMGKMFTATDIASFESFSIKCDPETIEELRAQHIGLQEPSYFSKKHWSKALTNGCVTDLTLIEWLDISYNLVVANLPKKVKKELHDLMEEIDNQNSI